MTRPPLEQAPALAPRAAAPREDERALLERLVAGDDLSWGRVYQAHAPEIFRLARRFVHSDAEAEEVLQEVFLSAFRHIGRFEGKARLRTWLYRITVNRALKRTRWWRRRREVSEEALPERVEGRAGPAREIEARQAVARTWALLHRLDQKKRTVLILHELEGLDTKAIAEIIGCPRSTVLTRLSRGRAELIHLAEQEGLLG
ncbi:RNA polymerase sigma factor [Myxococcota bacterium]|nr:RNA polymerase sigma factor [Myxococcota bacterium]MBU1429654.1 RNA polymerase sigma factor [Myxococcota bacterium]MBU1899346.1 RNA polymerase sigma factor [Myxococcota bacterium]